MEVDTICQHCGQSLRLKLDSALSAPEVLTPGATPLVFSPLVDFKRLRDPSIIDAF